MTSRDLQRIAQDAGFLAAHALEQRADMGDGEFHAVANPKRGIMGTLFQKSRLECGRALDCVVSEKDLPGLRYRNYVSRLTGAISAARMAAQTKFLAKLSGKGRAR